MAAPRSVKLDKPHPGRLSRGCEKMKVMGKRRGAKREMGKGQAAHAAELGVATGDAGERSWVATTLSRQVTEDFSRTSLRVVLEGVVGELDHFVSGGPERCEQGGERQDGGVGECVCVPHRGRAWCVSHTPGLERKGRRS